MTRAERTLYHQIHPLKLLTDLTTSFASSWLLWESQWTRAAWVAFLPSILMSAVLVWRGDLERYAASPLGRYVAIHMTARATWLRIAGQVVMWIGAAMHIPWLLPLGFLIVLFGWARGLWTPSPR